MSEIPKELRKRRNAILLAASENGGEFASDEDMEAFQLIERIARAEAKAAALEAENGRLKAPMTEEEWDRNAVYGCNLVRGIDRISFRAILAARAQQPSPAQYKEQP